MVERRVDLIRTTLQEQGRSQTWLAARLSLGRSLLSKYLNGHRQMPDEVFRKAASELGLPIDIVSFFIQSSHACDESAPDSEDVEVVLR